MSRKLLNSFVAEPRKELRETLAARRDLFPYRGKCPILWSTLTAIAHELVDYIRNTDKTGL